MTTISLAEAKNHLSRLVDEVCDGKEIIISKHGRPMARLSAATKPKGLRFGLMKGKLSIPDDFDAPLPDGVLAGFEGRD